MCPTFSARGGWRPRSCGTNIPSRSIPSTRENPLMVMPGALTGTRSPYSGRTNVCGFSPQSHPYTWFTRASIGANWGHELKRAGLRRPGHHRRQRDAGAHPDPRRRGQHPARRRVVGAGHARGAGRDRRRSDGNEVPHADHRRGGREPVAHRHHPDRQHLGRRAGRLWRGDGQQEAQGDHGDRDRRTSRSPIPSGCKRLFKDVAAARRRACVGCSRRMDRINEQLAGRGRRQARRLVPCTHVLPHALPHRDQRHARVPLRPEVVGRHGLRQRRLRRRARHAL